MEPWRRSIAKIVSTIRDYDYDNPWRSSSSTLRGTAVAIAGGRLLCSANVVANATLVRVSLPERPEAAVARVHSINHDCDLALLEIVDRPEIVMRLEPVTLAAFPKLRDEVVLANCIDTTEVVRGIVSRIAVVRYSHSQRHVLAVAVDAAAEDGVGPVFLGDGLAGITMQRLKGEDRALEIVPVPVIESFLARAEAGGRFSLPALGVTTQNLENPRLRAHVGLGDDDQGVLVIHVDHEGSADGVLQCGDVLTAIEGMPILDNGMVLYRGEVAVRYDVVIGLCHVGDRIRLDIRRAGRAMTVQLALAAWNPLVPRARYDEPPRFVVYGGLVFQPLTRDYLTTWDEWWNKAPKEFLHYYYSGHRTPEQHEIVVLTRILEDELTTGYAHLYNEAIARLDGAPVRDWRDFVDRLDTARGTVIIETTSAGRIVLDAQEVRAATPGILAAYEITATGR